MALIESARAPGLIVDEAVVIPGDARIGAHVVIHGPATIGAECLIQDGVALGGRRGNEAREDRENEPLVLEDGVTVCNGASVNEGAHVEAGALIGDLAVVRRGARIGARSRIGIAVTVGTGIQVGRGVRIQTYTTLAAPSTIEDEVFLGPGVVFTNDRPIAREGEDVELIGPILRRGCRIGAGVILMPGVEVGENALVGAGSLVTRDVAPNTLVMGAPARHVRDLTE